MQSPAELAIIHPETFLLRNHSVIGPAAMKSPTEQYDSDDLAAMDIAKMLYRPSLAWPIAFFLSAVCISLSIVCAAWMCRTNNNLSLTDAEVTLVQSFRAQQLLNRENQDSELPGRVADKIIQIADMTPEEARAKFHDSILRKLDR